MGDYWRRSFQMQLPAQSQAREPQGPGAQLRPQPAEIRHERHELHERHERHEHHEQHERGMWSQHRDSFAPSQRGVPFQRTPSTPSTPTPSPSPPTATPSAPTTPDTSAQTQAALTRTTAFLQGGATDVGTVQQGTDGVIVADAADSNGAADTDPSSARYQQAASLVQQNGPAVSSALAQLSPSMQQQYSSLNAQLQADPVAQLAAQSLLLGGDLSQNDSQGQTLLSTLSGIGQNPSALAAGIDPKQFVAQLTKEVATPDAINQQNTEDCTGTQASILMDRLDGAEYARLATQAASPSGTVTWADGTQTTRQGGVPQGTGQSLPQEMLQSVANQAAGATTAGVTSQGLATLMGKMFDRTMSSQQIDPSNITASQADMMSKVTGATANNAPVSAAIILSDAQGNPTGTHEVLVNSVSNGTVEYTNPWGDEEEMSVADFQSRLTSVNYDPTSLTMSRSQLFAQSGQYLSV